MGLTVGKLWPMAKRKGGGWITVPEAAKRAGVSREAVYKAIRRGRLKAKVREFVRRALAIDAASLAAFIRAHKQAVRRQPKSRPGSKASMAVDRL